MNDQSSRFMKALRRERVDRIPVWIMRQAGRYLPEYLKIREKAKDFMTLCKTPELACEVTLQPIQRFGFDASIIFSDILTIPDAMGLEVYFEENLGPRFKKVIQSIADVEALPIPDPDQDLSYVLNAIRLVRHELDQTIPLIGFSGSPWTLATYMLEGGSSKDFKKIKSFMYQEPQATHQLLEKLTKSIQVYLKAQVSAGASVVMVFDSWGGILSTSHYLEFSLSYLKKIVDDFKNDPKYVQIPIILFTKNGALWFEKIMKTGCDAIGVDWVINLEDAFQIAQGQVAIQGNLDPIALFADELTINHQIHQLLKNIPTHQGYIFNLGHGILPHTPIAHVEAMIETVRSFKEQ